jgi:hypothetical protein
MEQYIHLLIARPDDFAPLRQQIAAFCQSLIDHRVLPNVDRLSVSTPSGQVRTVTNPFTGEPYSFPTYAHQRLQKLDEFEAAANGLANYCLHLEGDGTPDIPPVPIDSPDPYSIAVRCHVTAVPYSTSSIYDNDNYTAQYVQFNRPCEDSVPFGYFTAPTSHETVEVADAGRARFWIEFELGKWLFPSVKRNNLSILNPTILKWAERDFGIQFAQGCHYF